MFKQLAEAIFGLMETPIQVAQTRQLSLIRADQSLIVIRL
jgi:hypothetical protein